MGKTDIRKSHMDIGRVYFWTATVNNWFNLLEDDKLKEIVISSLRYLVQQRKLEVYGFVIMPNHIHLIWQLLQMNGKEMPHTSFLKFTAHAFEKYLQSNALDQLRQYRVDATNKAHEFWQRDSLAFELFKKQTIKQKLDYIHYNPVMNRWALCKEPSDYYYSSARFYEKGIDHFKFITHIGAIL